MNFIKNLFSISFGVTVFFRAFTWHFLGEYIPYTIIYLSFISFWGFFAFSQLKKFSFNSQCSHIIVLLIGFYIIWGLSNIVNLDFVDTFLVMIRSLLMLSFISISCFWICKYNCLIGVIKSSFFALSILLIGSFFYYFNEINLYSTIGTFWISDESLRTRVRFGFNNNIAAEYGLSVILMSLVIFKSINKKRIISKILLLNVDFLMILIILASNSRGTTLALFFLMLIYPIVVLIRKNKILSVAKILTFFLLIVISVIVIATLFYQLDLRELLSGTNRTHFFSNIDCLRASERWLMGLGNISGSYFSNRNVLYGVPLDYMEVSYVGFFVMNGIIGCLWIGYIIYILIYSSIKCIELNNEYIDRFVLILLLYMLLISCFEGYIFSYTYITSTIFLLFILSNINIVEKKWGTKVCR